jgi:WD40 repeat protein
MSRPPFLALFALTLSGCLSIPLRSDSADAEPVPDLVMSRPPHSFVRGLGMNSISEDGNTSLGWEKHYGVQLIRASDYSVIEKFYEEDRSQLKFERDVGETTGYIQGAGFFDNNTWYFGVVPNDKDETGKRRMARRIDIHIRSIQPPREIAKYSFPWSNHARLIANKNHFAYIDDGLWENFKSVGVLVDWRTEAHYPIDTVHNTRGLTFYKLTGSSRVLSTYPLKDIINSGVFLVDPFSQQKEQLERHIFLSPDERYGIDLGDGRCKLRKFPKREVAPLDDKQIVGYCSGSLPKKDAWKYPVAFLDDGKFFVIALKNSFRVYRMEPFQLEFEGKMASSILSVNLSKNGMLATSDNEGSVRVWDVMKKQIIGQHRFDALPSSILFSPNGDQLYVIDRNLNVFQLPKRGAD